MPKREVVGQHGECKDGQILGVPKRKLQLGEEEGWGAPGGGGFQAAPEREEVSLELGAGQGDYEVRLRGYKKHQYCLHFQLLGLDAQQPLIMFADSLGQGSGRHRAGRSCVCSV